MAFECPGFLEPIYLVVPWAPVIGRQYGALGLAEPVINTEMSLTGQRSNRYDFLHFSLPVPCSCAIIED